MTNAELTAIEDRANAATTGPWKWTEKVGYAELRSQHTGSSSAVILDDGSAQCEYGAIIESDSPNAVLVAHCREDVPALCAEIRRLQVQVAREKRACLSWMEMYAKDIGPPPESVITDEQMEAWKREALGELGADEPDYEKSHTDATAALVKLDDMLLASDVEGNK